MAILELDLGNTRCKWRLVATAQTASATAPVDVVARGSLLTAELAAGNFPDQWAGYPALERVRVANVAGAAMAESLGDWMRKKLFIAPEFARVESHCAGVTCGYQQPQKLGVDRWLAVLAAHHLDNRAALIVDCGSAVTLDVLDTGGLHRGGYILPGLNLMRRALYRDTDAVKVPADFNVGMSLLPGHNTEDAVNHGLPLMVLGAIGWMRTKLAERQGGEPLLWITGGDGELFASLCPWPHRLVADLVLDGLALINPE